MKRETQDKWTDRPSVCHSVGLIPCPKTRPQNMRYMWGITFDVVWDYSNEDAAYNWAKRKTILLCLRLNQSCKSKNNINFTSQLKKLKTERQYEGLQKKFKLIELLTILAKGDIQEPEEPELQRTLMPSICCSKFQKVWLTIIVRVGSVLDKYNQHFGTGFETFP